MATAEDWKQFKCPSVGWELAKSVWEWSHSGMLGSCEKGGGSTSAEMGRSPTCVWCRTVCGDMHTYMLAQNVPDNGGCLWGGPLGSQGQTVRDLLFIIELSIQCEFICPLPIILLPSLIKLPFIHRTSSDPPNNLKR